MTNSCFTGQGGSHYSSLKKSSYFKLLSQIATSKKNIFMKNSELNIKNN